MVGKPNAPSLVEADRIACPILTEHHQSLCVRVCLLAVIFRHPHDIPYVVRGGRETTQTCDDVRTDVASTVTSQKLLVVLGKWQTQPNTGGINL